MKPENAVTVILDGPDCAGKTMAATTALRDLEATRFHHGPYLGETKIAHYYASSLTYQMRMEENVIMDRSWLSEPIYGGVMRGGNNRISVAHRRMLERLAWSTRSVTVIALPPWDTIHGCYMKRKADEYLNQIEKLEAVYNKFQSAMLDYDLPTMVYNWEGENQRNLTERVYDLAPNYNMGPGIGHWHPGESILIVGDRPSPRTKFDNASKGAHLPFVSFKEDGCSGWLAEQLEEAKIPESKLYWVNAHGIHGKAQLPAFVGFLQPRKIIALGRSAAQWCHRFRLPHEKIPHPQFWKRFHYNERYPLLEVLK